ncbi:glycine cleavage system protein GcvH [bacterium]|jgi:glycine cleavage system H protein|nr:glycine cleavage system protein GcvH [bacterium]
MIKYTNDHEWVKEESDGFTIGISEYAIDELGEIVFVELPEENIEIKKEDEFGTIESVKTVSSLYMPIDGTITAINQKLVDEPSLLNDNAKDFEWLIKIKTDSKEQFNSLMNEKEYQDFLETL